MYFIFAFFSSFHSPPGTMRQRPPTHSTPVASPLQHPPHHRHQLLVDSCVFRLNGGNLTPTRHPPSLNFIFSIPIRHPKRQKNVLPTRSDPEASNLQCPSHHRHYHSVGCCVMTAKQRPPKAEACIFHCLSFCPPKLMNQRHRAQARRLATCVWHWGAAAPRFRGAAALPMEREGEVTGGRAAAHFFG